MREIKFRAWDKIDKKMYYNVGFSMSGVQIYDDIEKFPDTIILDRGKDCFEVMQYTELKDINGRDIYEGDIVIPIHNEEEGFSYVKFGHFKHDWSCGEYDPSSAYGFYIQYNDKWETQKGLGFDLSESIKFTIIGNIYQSPELLKGE